MAGTLAFATQRLTHQASQHSSSYSTACNGSPDTRRHLVEVHLVAMWVDLCHKDACCVRVAIKVREGSRDHTHKHQKPLP